jgi:hypothetical protein
MMAASLERRNGLLVEADQLRATSPSTIGPIRATTISTTSRWFFAASSRVRRFNEDIDAWLTAAHRHCPVLAAHRAQDTEAGGTELSDWHAWSVQRLPELLPALEPVAAACAADPDGEDSSVADLLRGVAEAAVASEMELPAYLRRWAS